MPVPRLLRTVAALLLAGTALASCGSDPAPQRGPTAGAYATVVRWFVDRSGTQTTAAEDDDVDETTVVFVEPRGEGMTFGVDMQAEIIEATEPFADLRFIDDRAEALDDEGLVRDGSIFLALGPSTPKGSSTTIECDEISSDASSRPLVFELRWRRDEWVLAGPPSGT